MSIKVVVIGCFDDSFMSRFVEGFSSSERDSFLHVTYYRPQIHETGETHGSAMTTLVEEAFMEAPHIVVPIGVLANRAVIEKTRNMGNRPFICSTAIFGRGQAEVLRLLGTPGSLVTSVELEPVPLLLAAQTLLEVYSRVMSILIVCNPDNQEGRVGYDAEKISGFFSQKGKRVKRCYVDDSKKEESIRSIKSAAKGFDALMFVSGDSTVRFHSDLVAFCDEQHIDLIADGEEAIRRGASFGLNHDIEFLGRKCRERVAELAHTIQHTTRSSLEKMIFPALCVKNSFKLLVSKKAYERGGVILVPDVTSYCEKNPDDEINPFLPINTSNYSTNKRCHIGFIGNRNILRWNTLLKSLIRLVDNRKDNKLIDFKVQPISITAQYDGSYTSETKKDLEGALLAHKEKSGVQYDVIVACDKELQKEAASLMQELNLMIPIVAVIDCDDQYEYEVGQSESSGKVEYDKSIFAFKYPHSSENNTIKCCIKQSEKNLLVRAFSLMNPQGKVLIFVHDIVTKGAAPFLQVRVYGVTVRVVYMKSFVDIHEFLGNMNEKADGVILDDRFQSAQLISSLLAYCSEYNIASIAYGLELITRPSVVYSSGRNWSALGQFIIDEIVGRQLVNEGKSPRDIGDFVVDSPEQIFVSEDTWEGLDCNARKELQLLVSKILIIKKDSNISKILDPTLVEKDDDISNK